MPIVISPSINLSATSAPASGARGRGAEQAEGQSFGAAFDRSRAASRTNADDAAETAVPTPGAGRKPVRVGEKKSELSAADVMAMLAPLPAQVAHTTAGARAGATAGTSDAEAADGVQRALPGDASTLSAAAQEAGAEHASTAAATEAKDDAAHAGTADAALRAAAQTATEPKIPPGATTAASSSTPDIGAALAPPAAALMPQPSAAIATATAASSTKAASAKDAAAAVATDTTPSTPPAISIESESGKTPALSASTASADASTLDADGGAAPQPLPQFQVLAAAPGDRAAAPASATPVLTVAPPVGSDAWGPAIGQQMIRMSASGHHVAELNLNPTGLGPLKVTLTMGDNQAQAMFMSAHESVRKAVEAALPQLRTTLAEQGINLGQTSVGAETRQPFGQGGAFADQNPSRSQQGPSDYPGANRIDTAAATTRTAATSSSVGRTGSGLDTFA